MILAEVWIVPRQVGDVYMALAGGRDVVDGKLARPDDWAFTTHGRVWVNQNWGTGLLFYMADRAGGDNGLIALKALLVVLAAGTTAMAVRQRGVNWPLAVLVASGILGTVWNYVDLRPNLITLILTPLMLWLLRLSLRRPHTIWLAAALVAVWSNMHGGFSYGIAMMGLWAACVIVPPLFRKIDRAAAVRYWPLVAATLAALGLSIACSPFGIVNLTHPFVVAGEQVWRDVIEWQPIFGAAMEGYDRTWEFLALLGVFVVAMVARLTTKQPANAKANGAPPLAGVSAAAFDAILIIAAVWMALTARRFIPLAAIVMAPVLGGWLGRIIPDCWLTKAQCCAAVAAMLLTAALAEPVTRPYWPDNPLRFAPTFALRMFEYEAFPDQAAQFLAANDFSGPIYNEWKWEGYLRWRCPQLKFFVGGRAQQVYDVRTELMRRQIVSGESAEALLKATNVHLAIMPVLPRNERLLGALTYRKDSRWTYIYCDSRAAILADCDWPETRRIADAAATGKLIYPDPAIADLSRGMCLYAAALGDAPSESLSALSASIERWPTLTAFAAIGNLMRQGKIAPESIQDFLQAQEKQLAAMRVNGPGGERVLQCRRAVYNLLSSVYQAAGRTADADTCRQRGVELTAEIRSVSERW